VSDDDLASARVALMAALRESDAALAYRLVLGLMDDGYPMPVLVDEVLAPIQWESGRRWEVGDVSIPEEHASTAAIETLVSMLAGAFGHADDADVVVVACAVGDPHTLPARMASALLAYEGYRALYLGTSVPADDLGEYLRSAGATALVVSCTRVHHLLGARACIAASHAAGVPVVVGGRAFSEGRRWEHLGADAYAPRLSQLAEVLQTWTPDPVLAEGRAAPVPATAEALEADRARFVEAVSAAVVADVPAADPHRRALALTAGELVDAAAVALHLGDAALLAEQAGWLASRLGHAGLPVTAPALLEALATATSLPAPDRGVLDAALRLTR
jgi:methanogenic corrinoid protein MtbC1